MKKYNPFKILSFIPFGKENAISMEELAIRMNTDKRTVRKRVFTARVKGSKICSTCERESTAGYYRPISAADAIPYVKMQRSRIQSAQAALKPIEDFISGVE